MKHDREYSIVAVRHDNQNHIVEVKFDNGEVMSTEEAAVLAEAHKITNVSVSHSQLGRVFLRSLPDTEKSNNLDSLPEMK